MRSEEGKGKGLGSWPKRVSDRRGAERRWPVRTPHGWSVAARPNILVENRSTVTARTTTTAEQLALLINSTFYLSPTFRLAHHRSHTLREKPDTQK